MANATYQSSSTAAVQVRPVVHRVIARDAADSVALHSSDPAIHAGIETRLEGNVRAI
jgi:hypothetical protein